MDTRKHLNITRGNNTCIQRSEDISNESTKHKLTLGVDRKVIEKAKAAGVNISVQAERWLKVLTYLPTDGNSRDDVVRAYEAIFENMQSLMCKYNSWDLEICVGEKDSRKVCLHSGCGLSLWDDQNKDTIYPSVDGVLDILYKPMRILENLLVALTEYAEENKEKISELKFALRLVKALSDDEGEHKN